MALRALVDHETANGLDLSRAQLKIAPVEATLIDGEMSTVNAERCVKHGHQSILP